MTPPPAASDPAQHRWRRLWQQRLAQLSGPCPALTRLQPSLLWGVAVPMLGQLEERLQGSGPAAAAWRGGTSARRPPVLALNAPVGAGKSTLAAALASLAPLAGMRLAVASIDDLYLPWPQRQRALAGNPFHVGRVPPGSHDLPVLLEALQQWRHHGSLRLPRFDKTLRQGQGDRSGWQEQPADALLLEGWLLGCRSLGAAALASAMAELRSDSATSLTLPLSAAELAWLPHWDRQLANYQPLWQACDGLWLLRPSRWTLPLRWRLQAEARQRRRGGGWLAAAELVAMVRASLCSLPPELYQLPLDIGAEEAGAAASLPTAGAVDGTGEGRSRQQAVAPGEEIAPIPLLGRAVLDPRRHCRVSWVQASDSSASSATG